MSTGSPDDRKRASTRRADYKVGYGKPPKQSRFKPGQSGNPAGSSKKARERNKRPEALRIEDKIARFASRDVTIMEDGKPLTVKASDRWLMRLEQFASKDRIALFQLIKLARDAENLHIDRVCEEILALMNHREKWRPIFEQHLKDGEPLPMVFPHPDDIQVHVQGGRGYVLGPMSEDELHRLQYLLKVREACEKEIERIEAAIAETVAEQEAEMALWEPEIRAELGPTREHLWREEWIAEGFDAPEMWLSEERRALEPYQDKIDEIDAEFEDRGWLRRDARAEMVKAFREKEARIQSWLAKRLGADRSAAPERPSTPLAPPAPAPGLPAPAEPKPYDLNERLSPGEWPYGNDR